MKQLFFLLALIIFSTQIFAQSNPKLTCSVYGLGSSRGSIVYWDHLLYTGILDDNPTLILIDKSGTEFKNVKWSDLSQEDKVSLHGWRYYKANFHNNRPSLIVGGVIDSKGERILLHEGSNLGVMFPNNPAQLSFECTIQK